MTDQQYQNYRIIAEQNFQKVVESYTKMQDLTMEKMESLGWYWDPRPAMLSIMADKEKYISRSIIELHQRTK